MTIEELQTVCELLDLHKVKVRGTDIMASCPFHEDKRPSFGLSSEKEVWHCFSCNRSGTITDLVADIKDISIEEARILLATVIEDKKNKVEEIPLRRYEDTPETAIRCEMPYESLAIYRSGNIVHPYFIKRGFTADDQERFLFGWDSEKKRVTVPVFWADGKLCGFIGRAVLNEKTPEYKLIYGNMPKYYVYDGFPRAGILFPLNLFEPVNNTVILVEGLLDALWLHKHGFKNALAILTSGISQAQISLLRGFNIQRVILCLDNDKAGQSGCKRIYDLCLKDYVFSSVKYPEGCKDVQDMTKEQLIEMFNNLEVYPKVELRKIE